MGGRKGGGTTVQQTTSSAPWSGQQPYLLAGFGQAQAEHARPMEFFPGQTYASFSPQTENALNLTEQRALAGSPVQNSMNAELLKTLGGDYLYGGPGFDAAFQAAANKITPKVQSDFNRGGRLHSGLAKQAETSALADAFASQYSNERQNQLRAMLFTPEAAQSDYNDLKALAGVGTAREGQTQSAIDDAMARHNFNQENPRQKIADYMALINGQYAGSSGTSTTNETAGRGNRGAGLLGGALSGAYLGKDLGAHGALAGGALGALAGLF